MTTKEAFRKLVFRDDSVKRTSMSYCQRSIYRAYFDGKLDRNPKPSTMEKYLREYGFIKIPERWNEI